MAKVTLNNVTKKFDDIVAVHAVNMEIEDGEFMVFVGPSGCGKSTTLRMIAGLEEVSDGQIFFNKRNVTDLEPKDRKVAMVFQNYALYPHKSVFENMAFALRMAKLPKEEIEKQVHWAAGVLKLEDLLTRKPKQLSGGQMQRVALGRAIVRNPEVFLLDEPLSNLDAKLRVRMRGEIAKLHNKIGTSMVYVTHDQVEAMTLGDRIVVMRDGMVQQIGAPMELYDYPANLFVGNFIGSPEMNAIEGTVEGSGGHPAFTNGGGFSVPLDRWNNGKSAAPAPGHEVTLGIRPEHIELGPAGASGDNTLLIEVIERMGGQTLVIGEVGGLSINVFLDRDDDLTRGQRREISFPQQFVHLFDRQNELSLR